MLVGNDVSVYQPNIDWNTYKDNTNFVIIRSSYGVNNVDTEFTKNRDQARQLNIPHGFYHYAYAQINSPIDEANFFLQTVSPLQNFEMLFLDFEETYQDPVTWCKTFLDTLSQKLNGYKPLVYLNLAQVQSHDWSPVYNAGYGLWLAYWNFDPNKNDFQTPWPVVAFRQWTDKQQVPGITTVADGDVFYGDATEMQKYGVQIADPCLDIKNENEALKKQLHDATAVSQEPVLIDKIIAYIQSLRGGGK